MGYLLTNKKTPTTKITATGMKTIYYERFGPPTGAIFNITLTSSLLDYNTVVCVVAQ